MKKDSFFQTRAWVGLSNGIKGKGSSLAGGKRFGREIGRGLAKKGERKCGGGTGEEVRERKNKKAEILLRKPPLTIPKKVLGRPYATLREKKKGLGVPMKVPWTKKKKKV